MKWVEMLGECHEMLAHQRATPRWKEWIPLVTQQLRLRNLIQVIAYNVSVGDKLKSDSKSKDSRPLKMKVSFYYTLHLTTMSAPFYTSEKLENENPKWAEVEIGDAVNSVNASVTGIVVRLWVHRDGSGAGEAPDQVLTVWGVSFSGLAYLGPRPAPDPRAFAANTLVFHMRGGYFTAPQCQREPRPPAARERRTAVRLAPADVKPSYSVPLVSRLHTIQQAIKKQRAAATTLRERISTGEAGPSAGGGGASTESSTLRRLLARGRPPAHAVRQRALSARRRAEEARCRVTILRDERARAARRLQALQAERQRLLDANQDRGLELMNNYQELHKDMERLKDQKKMYTERRDVYRTTNAQLVFRKKQLISKLNQIYPIQKMSNGEYTICGVHLPNSEDFAGKDELMISVSLGYVAHLLQMISCFLQVPLRYPVIHFGSCSKIIDHVVDKIPEKEREFPLSSKGKDKLQFSYGVYLLNKNVSQLRWYCGLTTHDLRTTLPNLCGLLHIPAMEEGPPRLSASSVRRPAPLPSEPSPPASPLPPMALEPPPAPPLAPFLPSASAGPREGRAASTCAGGAGAAQTDGGLRTGAPLSLSLDKGLDEFHLAQRMDRLLLAEVGGSDVERPSAEGSAARGGSEPSLAAGGGAAARAWASSEAPGDSVRKMFLRRWQEGGPAPQRADDEHPVADGHPTVYQLPAPDQHPASDQHPTSVDQLPGPADQLPAPADQHADDVRPADDEHHPDGEHPALLKVTPAAKEAANDGQDEAPPVSCSGESNDHRTVIVAVDEAVTDTAVADKTEIECVWKENEELDATNPFYEPPVNGNHCDGVEASKVLSEMEVCEEEAGVGEKSSIKAFSSRRKSETASSYEGEVEGRERSVSVPVHNTTSDLDAESNPKLERLMGDKRAVLGVTVGKKGTAPRRRAISEAAEECPSAEETERLSMLEEALSLDAVSGLLERTVFVDSAFASVASRTEALASRAGSFNLVRSRHSSALDD